MSEPPSSKNLEITNGVPLLALAPNQCVLAVTADLFDMFGQSMWLDNLYMRLQWRELADTTFNRCAVTSVYVCWVLQVYLLGI